MPSWSEEDAAGPPPWETVCAAGVVRSTVAELGDTTFAFPLCFLCVFWVWALIGDDGDAMGSVMVVLSGGNVLYYSCSEYPVNGPCMPWHGGAFSRENILQTR
jgi:hypothetical protein